MAAKKPGPTGYQYSFSVVHRVLLPQGQTGALQADSVCQYFFWRVISSAKNPPKPLKYLIAGAIFIIASLTDFLDGYIARKYNLVTNTGKMLDAIADKVLVSPILILLACSGYVPVIIPVIYITRDIVVDAIKMQSASKGKVVAAIKSGKWKTASMMVGITLVFFYNMPFEFINIRVDLFLLYFACIMAVVSAVEYFVQYRKLEKVEII